MRHARIPATATRPDTSKEGSPAVTSDIETQVNRQTVEFIRAGYAGASLQFKVQADTLATFRECLWAIGGYNDFAPGAVSDALAPVLPDCAGIEIGREFSPVLYVSVPRWTHHTFAAREAGERDAPAAEYITEEDREILAARIMQAGKAAGASEADVTLTPPDCGTIGNTIIDVRLWWD
jgi:hypothetical protein